MSGDEPKLVLVVCGDRAIQDSVRRIVEAAGCRAALVTGCEAATHELERAAAVVTLVDPLLAEACRPLASVCPLVIIPLRVSSTGVRRMARRNESAVRWLTALVAQHCAPT